MNTSMPGSMAQWKELAHLLEVEWRGQPVDPARIRDLAGTLLPQHPELTNVLNHIRQRMGQAH